MSRSKKSRKPGGAPTAKPKLSKQELEKVEKRTRKSTGKVAGNRQKEAVQEQHNSTQSVKKDPRLGNKTPIALGKIVAKVEKAVKEKVAQNKKNDPIAPVRFIEPDLTELKDITASPDLSAEEELEAIEQDEALQSILAKQEDDIALTEQEVDYYNYMMDRHQALSAELGLEDDDDSDDDKDNAISEDGLWDKLDNTNLSDFKEK